MADFLRYCNQVKDGYFRDTAIKCLFLYSYIPTKCTDSCAVFKQKTIFGMDEYTYVPRTIFGAEFLHKYAHESWSKFCVCVLLKDSVPVVPLLEVYSSYDLDIHRAVIRMIWASVVGDRLRGVGGGQHEWADRSIKDRTRIEKIPSKMTWNRGGGNDLKSGGT